MADTQPAPARSLTPEQRAWYVKSAYGSCPYCGNRDIAGAALSVDDNQVTQDVACQNPGCERSWTDVYTLTGIEETP